MMNAKQQLLLIDINIAHCGWVVYNAVTDQILDMGVIKTESGGKKRTVSKADEAFERHRMVFRGLMRAAKPPPRRC